MKSNNVPQHNISTYGANKKAMYAVDDEGRYTIVPSSGWRVEEEATKQALQELKQQARYALEQAQQGIVAPLYYHMFANRMDLQTLAQSTGLFKWRIKRHFQPAVFNRLSLKILTRYADALGLTVTELQQLPEVTND